MFAYSLIDLELLPGQNFDYSIPSSNLENISMSTNTSSLPPNLQATFSSPYLTFIAPYNDSTVTTDTAFPVSLKLENFNKTRITEYRFDVTVKS